MAKYHRLNAGLGWQMRRDKHGLSRVRVGADSYLGGAAGVTVRDLARHLGVSAARVRASLCRLGLWEGYQRRGALNLEEAQRALVAHHASGRGPGRY